MTGRHARYLLCALSIAAACEPLERRPRATSTLTDTAQAVMRSSPVATPSPATKLLTVEGFLTPESVLHDARQDIYFVSNIHGRATRRTTTASSAG
ncbi:MAG: hypothetical protein ACREMJ_09730 [Gemmatimonadales bacterium]